MRAYRLLPHRGQNWLLLVASYYFYAAWDYRFLALLIASTIVDFTCGLLMAQAPTAAAPAAARHEHQLQPDAARLLQVLQLLRANAAGAVRRGRGWRVDFVVLHVLLPVGISFYTFVTMSYVIDVYRREIAADAQFRGFRAYSWRIFPHLVAGPIMRATSAAAADHQRRARSRREQIRDGAVARSPGGSSRRFSWPTTSRRSPSRVFAPGAHEAGINVLLGTYAFAFQIYGDFAGYSNIARGTSKLMGIELIENFRFPYLVVTPQAFWRNWHISLSTWLRDYLYIPLGGNRGTPAETRRNLMMTMVLGGLWHGAAWTFVLCGDVPGRAPHRVSAVRASASRRSRGCASRAARGCVMFHATCAGWLIFRAASMGDLARLVRSLRFRLLAGVHRRRRTCCCRCCSSRCRCWSCMLVQARYDDILAIPRRVPVTVRYSVYVATLYLIFLFGNFGGVRLHLFPVLNAARCSH